LNRNILLKLVFGSKIDKSTSTTYYTKDEDLLVKNKFLAFEIANSVLNKIENETIENTKVSHLFKYNDFSFWWFIFPSIINKIKKITSLIDVFEKIIDEKNPSLIQSIGDFDKLSLIEKICYKKNIEFQYSKIKYFQFILQNKIKQFSQNAYRFRKITLEKQKKRCYLFNSKFQTMPSLENKIVFAVATAYRRKIYDYKKRTSTRGEYIVDPLIKKINELDFEVVGIDLDYTFRGDFEVLSERLNESIPWIPIEYTMKIYPSSSNYKIFLDKFQNLLAKNEFQKIFNYKGINFWNLIEPDFLKLSYYPHLPTYIHMIDSLTKFFASNKPKAVFIPYEVGPYALAIILACKKNQIKTIGMQHGMIWGTNPDYSHRDFRSKNNPLGMPMPDVTLLFGDFSRRRLLENKTYPNEKLIVFGNPAFFDLEPIQIALASQDLKKKYDIPKNKKILLLTTSKDQSYYRGDEIQTYDEQLLKKLLEIYSNHDNYYVVIKPHPGREYTGLYQKLIDQKHAKNFVIIQDDLFELLYLSNLHLSVASTALIDSIALGKLTIRVDFKGGKYPIPFEEYGILEECTLDTLENSIDRLLSNHKTQQIFLEKQKKFIKDQYNIPNEHIIKQLKAIIN